MRLLMLLTTLACVLPSVWSHTYLVNPKPRNQAAYTRNPVAVPDVIKYPYVKGMFSSFNTIGWCGTPAASRTAAPIPGTSVASNFPAPPVTTSNTYTAGGTIKVYWWHALPHADPNIGSAAAPIFQYGIRVALNYSATDMVVLNPHVGGTAKSVNGIVNGHIEQGTGSDPQATAQGWVPNATFVLPAGKTCTNCVLQFWLDSASDAGGYVDCADISITAAVAVPPTTAAPAPSTPPTTTKAPTTTTTAPAATGGATTTATTAPADNTNSNPNATPTTDPAAGAAAATSAPTNAGITQVTLAPTDAPVTPVGTTGRYSSSTRVASNLLLAGVSIIISWLVI